MDTYPWALLPPETERWRLTGQAVGGGVSVAGAPGLARTDGGGFWTAWMNNVVCDSLEKIRTARALELILDGGVTPMIVPCFDWVFAAEGVPHSDDAPFSDGGLYHSSPVLAEANAALALRATVVTLDWQSAKPLMAGERFSILHPTKSKRLYGIKRILNQTADSYEIEISPPMREAVTSSTPLDFADPGCVMRLANPDDFLGALDPYHESVANAVWVEHF